ncbi:MAG: hypothetical protein KF819_02650 [Labilithrix sp.]|nr:hypothetical protein [Labilithrix sp.]
MTRSSLARFLSFAVLAALPAACGDVYADPVRDTGMATSARPPSSAFPGPTIEERMLPCPNQPLEGSACGSLGMTCEYGVSPDATCNTTLTCIGDASFGGAWVARPSKLCPTYDCPRGAMATIRDQPCDLPRSDAGPPSEADELACPMDDGVCACTTGRDAAHAHPRRWVCVTPRPSCPATRPLAGQSCVAARQCDYGSCDFKQGMQMDCRGDVWLAGGATCN